MKGVKGEWGNETVGRRGKQEVSLVRNASARVVADDQSI